MSPANRMPTLPLKSLSSFLLMLCLSATALAQGAWTPKAPMPTPRSHVAVGSGG